MYKLNSHIFLKKNNHLLNHYFVRLQSSKIKNTYSTDYLKNNFIYIKTKFDNSLSSNIGDLNFYITPGMFCRLMLLPSKSFRKSLQNYLTSFNIIMCLAKVNSIFIIKPLTLRYFLINYFFKKTQEVLLLHQNPIKFKKYRRVKK